MRKGAGALSAILIVSALAAFGASAGAKTGRAAAGKADSGTAYVANTPKPGKFVYAAGYNQDKILGNGPILYVIKATPSTAGTIKVTTKSVALYTATGSLSGSATATLTIPKKGPAKITNGKLNLTKGAGSLVGHSLVATFTGSGTIAGLAFTFHYTGTYK